VPQLNDEGTSAGHVVASLLAGEDEPQPEEVGATVELGDDLGDSFDSMPGLVSLTPESDTDSDVSEIAPPTVQPWFGPDAWNTGTGLHQDVWPFFRAEQFHIGLRRENVCIELCINNESATRVPRPRHSYKELLQMFEEHELPEMDEVERLETMFYRVTCDDEVIPRFRPDRATHDSGITDGRVRHRYRPLLQTPKFSEEDKLSLGARTIRLVLPDFVVVTLAV
jgi:hypothetical protein